jgi:hypothetical protein
MPRQPRAERAVQLSIGSIRNLGDRSDSRIQSLRQ